MCGVKVHLHTFLTSELFGGEWAVHGETAPEINRQAPGWAPEPAWTVWRRGGALFLPLICAFQSLA
jgi:hypothetical protein